MAQANVKLTVDARNAVSSLNNTTLATNKLSAAAKGATGSLATTSKAAKGLAASLATTMGPIIALGAAFSTLNSGLRVFSDRQRDVAILTQGLQNLDEGVDVLNRLQKAASKLGNETLFDQEEFTRGFNLLTSFRKIGVDSYERVAQAAADIAQLNQVDVKTSFMQLAKALEDPERNLSTLNRSGISFNKTQTDTIKKLMKANKTAEAHAMILKVVNEAYNKTAQAAATGFAGNVDSLGEAFRDFAEVLGKALIPVIDPAVKGLTALLNFFSSEGGQVTAIIAGIALAAKGLAVVLPILSTSFIAIKTSALIATGQLIGMNATLAATSAGFTSAATAATGFKLALAKTGIGLAIVGFGLLATEILKAVNAQREFNELLEKGSSLAIQKEIDKTKEVIGDLEEKEEIKEFQEKIASLKESMGWMYQEDNILQMQLDKANKELEKLEKRLPMIQGVELAREFEKTKDALVEKNKELKKILEKSKIETEEGKKQFDSEQRKKELVEKYGEELAEILIKQEAENQKIKDSIDLYKKKKDAAEKLKETLEAVGEEIEKNIKDNLREAITGAQSFGDAMKNVLNKIRDKLIDIALDQALSGLGKGIGGFLGKIFGGGKADGGPVSAGKTYLVGEKGPELLTMGSSGGFVTPNNKIGGESVTNNIVVNVDASGTAVQGDDANANQFGEQLAAAIQAEIINQKRSGGLLN